MGTIISKFREMGLLFWTIIGMDKKNFIGIMGDTLHTTRIWKAMSLHRALLSGEENEKGRTTRRSKVSSA